jgi:hypothetical protein
MLQNFQFKTARMDHEAHRNPQKSSGSVALLCKYLAVLSYLHFSEAH